MTGEEQKMKVQNCCVNCDYARDYTGTDDFFCASYGCMQRAEQYDCKSFKPREDLGGREKTMNCVDLGDETKHPCYTCIHKKVCGAKSTFAETEVKTTHPYIVVKLECTEYQKDMPTPKVPRFLENECTNPNQ